jgi:hypothetical protein
MESENGINAYIYLVLRYSRLEFNARPPSFPVLNVESQKHLSLPPVMAAASRKELSIISLPHPPGGPLLGITTPFLPYSHGCTPHIPVKLLLALVSTVILCSDV